MNELKKRSFVHDLSGVTLAFFLGQFTSFLTGICTARYFGPEGKGEIAILLLTITFMVSIFTLGIEFAFLSLAGKNRTRLGYYTNGALGLAILLGCLGCFATAIILFSFFPQYRHITILLSFVVFFNILYHIISSSLYVSGRILEESLLNQSNSIGMLIAIVSIVIFNGTMTLFFICYVFMSIGKVLIGMYLLKKYSIIKIIPRIDYSFWKKLLKFGIKVQPGTILKLSANKFDFFIVSYLVGTNSLGIYSVAVALSGIIMVIPSILGVMIQQRAAILKEKDAKQLMSNVHKITSSLLFMLIIILAITGKLALHILYGKNFATAYLPMLLLLPGIWAWGMWRNLTNELVSQGYPGHVSISTLMAVLLTVLLDAMLLPRFGINAAAFVSSVSYFTAFFYILIFYLKKKAIPLKAILVPNFSDIKSYRDYTITFLRGIKQYVG